MSELKPCPFCGGEAEIVHKPSGFDDLDFYWVKCKDECVTICNPETSEEEAIEVWNTRYERMCQVNWKDDDWGICECGGDVYRHDIHCSQCGAKVVK